MIRATGLEGHFFVTLTNFLILVRYRDEEFKGNPC